jgi:hypothetical protein
VYELTSFDLNNHFDDKMLLIEKYNPEKVYTVVHFEGKSKNYMVKRLCSRILLLVSKPALLVMRPAQN